LSAIAGIWSRGDPARGEAFCARLLDAQSVYGPHACDRRSTADYAAGRCLYRMLDEDRFDRQPLLSEDGRFLLVADLRLDNRGELSAELGLGAAAARLSDADILLRACLAWGRSALGRLLGDFAFALWDGAEASLWLARDTAGERPLHYRSGDGWFGFASLPAPLAALPGGAPEVDEERFACFVADLPPGGSRSFFAGVSLIEPGHSLVADRSGVRVERYWEPRRATLRLPREADYGEALREQLDGAVRRRLRRAGGGVAAQLSSGLDSSAVATSAAIGLGGSGERLLALTSAPRAGFSGPVVAGRIADEAPLAAATAAIHPNIDHCVVRPAGGSVLDLLEPSHRLSGQPVGHVCNNMWWNALNAEAASAGARVMLTGEAGNFTLSAGLGVDTLADLVRLREPARWWREARALTGRRDFAWRQVLNASLGPWLPEALYARLRGRSVETPRFVAAPWREAMRRRLAASGWETRPARDSGARRWAMLRTADPGNFRKRSLAEWGVEERDPTNDRRLVEFCFSLPPEALLREGESRPALRRALAGRVPEAVLDQRVRGYQMADWYERIKGDEVLDFARAQAGAGRASSIVDLEAVEAAARSWPTSGWEKRPTIYLYRMHLLRALSAAQFVTMARSGGLG
jgi:asparagine synthase (glutamine-hydrolysing)